MVDGFVKICEAVAGMVGLDKVSISKPWNSRVKTRSAAVEVSWTTKLPDSTHGGGSLLGSVLAASARRRRRSPMAADPRNDCPRWWGGGGIDRARKRDIL